MSQTSIPIEQREFDHEEAVRELERVAARWLDAKAAKGLVPQHVNLVLDLAIVDVRRAERRLREARKRES